MSPRQQAFSNHEKASEEKELFELIRMHPCICNLKSKAYKETGQTLWESICSAFNKKNDCKCIKAIQMFSLNFSVQE